MKRNPDDLFKVGIITSPHGVHGEVKVYPTTDDPARFKTLKEVYVKSDKSSRLEEVQSVKLSKNLVIVKFKGIDDRNTVESWRNHELYVTRENAVPLEEGEYFIADLIGLEVYTDENEKLGILDDVLTGSANDVYVVKQEKGADILIPVIKECVLDVDIDGGKVVVHLLPGLRELNEK